MQVLLVILVLTGADSLPPCGPCTCKTHHTAQEVKQDVLAKEARGHHVDKPLLWLLFASFT